MLFIALSLLLLISFLCLYQFDYSWFLVSSLGLSWLGLSALPGLGNITVIYSILSFSSLIHSSALVTLLIPASVFFFWIISLISICSLVFIDKTFLYLTFLNVFSTCASMLFQNLGWSSLSLLWIFFPIDLLFSLHLLVLWGCILLLHLGHIPLLSLTFWDCGFHFIGWRLCFFLHLLSALWWVKLRGLCWFLNGKAWFLSTGGWSWVLSLWWAGSCSSRF